jgi:hypothetical protein
MFQSIYPFATKYTILKTKDEIEGVLLKGFDSTYDFDHLQRFIREGRPLQFNDSTYSREIMISRVYRQPVEDKSKLTEFLFILSVLMAHSGPTN